MSKCVYFILFLSLLITGISFAGTRLNARGGLLADAPRVCEGDFSQKVAAVTGACSGLGKSMAEGLLQSGFSKVYFLCRDVVGVKIDRAVGVRVDLQSFESVLSAVENIHDEIDVLILNAGVWDNADNVSGLSKTAMVNHFSQFVLTEKLLPGIKNRDGKVVIISSDAHFGALDFRNDPTLLSEVYDSSAGFLRYGTSKLMNVLYANKLARDGVKAYSVSPGIIKTDLHRVENDQSVKELKTQLIRFLLYNMIGISTEEGAAATLYLSTCDGATPGAYVHGKLEKETAQMAYDIELQDFLYQYSVEFASKAMST